MTRKIIITLAGILLIALAVLIRNRMITVKEAVQEVADNLKEELDPSLPAVSIQTVENKATSTSISASGALRAYNRVSLFAEVQGLFDGGSGSFKAGEYYKKGSTLIRINSDEFQANIRAQRSNFATQIVSLLPDLRLDYPDVAPTWEAYLASVDVEKNTPTLPDFSTEQEKMYITGKGILSSYYQIKNLEERLVKYTIRAPFSGILTQATINKGALVSPGMQLGEFIDPSSYELQLPVNSRYLDLLKVGSQVKLSNTEETKNWNGKVIRINKVVDAASQTVQVFIQVRGQDLREGMFLKAAIPTQEIANAFEIDRKLLVDNDKVYAVQDNTLTLLTVEPVHFTENTAIVKGLSNGTQVLRKSVPGAYSGMQVKILQ